MMVTFEAKVPGLGPVPLLSAYASLFAQAEHALYVDLEVRGRRLNECKKEYLQGFGLTARQFNAVATDVRGKVEAAKEAQKLHIEQIKGSIASAEKGLKKAERRLAQIGKRSLRTRPRQKEPVHDADVAQERRRLRFGRHQRRRRLVCLRARLARVEADLSAGRVRICFGGKRLFRAQFHLAENGYTSLAEWRQEYRRARTSQFLCRAP
ncbi:MAG: hypothetical protein M0Z66_15535 [Thermaerobacter sp.]|nr:hypothetical protein [Thermaerobacter sp.]